MNKLNHRTSNPEWYKFIVENISEGKYLNNQYKEFWVDVLQKRKNNTFCSCGNDELDPHEYCTKCWLENPNAKWRWTFKKRSGFLCYDITFLRKVLSDNSLLHYFVTHSAKILETMRLYFYKKQNGKCGECNEEFKLKEMDLHHKLPVAKGGREIEENLILLCKICHKKHKFESYKK